MPKVSIEFNLPEEGLELETALKAQAYAYFLHDVENEVFRPARKHGYTDEDIKQAIIAIDSLVDKYGGSDFVVGDGECLNATYLVGLLETLYFRLKQDSGL